MYGMSYQCLVPGITYSPEHFGGNWEPGIEKIERDPGPLVPIRMGGETKKEKLQIFQFFVGV